MPKQGKTDRYHHHRHKISTIRATMVAKTRQNRQIPPPSSQNIYISCNDGCCCISPLWGIWGLPETIIFRTVFETCRAQFLKKLGFIYLHVFAQFVQSRVEIPEFHIDEAHEHHRVFRQIVHMSLINWPANLEIMSKKIAFQISNSYI